MNCKYCHNEIPDGSIFCNWCGERQVKVKKSKTEIKVPKPKQLPSGMWNIYLRAEGKSITEKTAELCTAKARAIRAGFLEEKKKAPKLTVQAAIDTYIKNNNNVLSPSTLRGYAEIRRNRFKAYHEKDLSSVDWQKAVNEEAATCGPKTLKNAWGLISRVMRYNGLEIPDVRLPQVPPKERPWLNYEQITVFLAAVYGRSCETAALLALHGLRRSELYAVTPAKIDRDGIHVAGSKVLDPDGNMVEKDTNKNNSSVRVVPIMIPRLEELFNNAEIDASSPYVTANHNNLYREINSVCRSAGLPEVGVHGLRRSFASLAYHLGLSERETMKLGGWNDFQTMHKIYIKLDNSDLKSAAGKMQRFYNLHTDLHTNSRSG